MFGNKLDAGTGIFLCVNSLRSPGGNLNRFPESQVTNWRDCIRNSQEDINRLSQDTFFSSINNAIFCFSNRSKR